MQVIEGTVFLPYDNGIDGFQQGCRSTSVGDIMIDEGHHGHLCMMAGWADMWASGAMVDPWERAYLAAHMMLLQRDTMPTGRIRANPVKGDSPTKFGWKLLQECNDEGMIDDADLRGFREAWEYLSRPDRFRLVWDAIAYNCD